MRLSRSATLLAPLFFLALVAAQLGCVAESSATGDEADLVGGKVDKRWPASGYLAHGKDVTAARKAGVSCGATLVSPNVVVTAAHCVLSAPGDTWVFGLGDVGSKTPITVLSVNVHPKFHEKPTSATAIRMLRP